MPIEGLMWVERYRPSDLSSLVNQVAIKERLESLLLKKEQLPHLLFAGPPGSGKTTTALIMAKRILGENWRDYTLALNASVAPETPVLVRAGAKVRLVDFKWLAERYFEDETSKYAYPSDLEVLSLDRASKRPEFKKVSNISRHSVPEIVEVDYKGGSVRMTVDHSIMALDDDGEITEKAVSDVRVGDFLITFRSVQEGEPTDVPAPEFAAGIRRGIPTDPRTNLPLDRVNLDAESAWVLGSYLAEGHAALPEGGGGVTALTYRYPEERGFVDRTSKYFEETMGLYSHSHTIVSGSSGRRSGIQLTICSKKLARFLANYFYTDGALRRVAEFKKVPDFVFNAPSEIRLEFLRGYMGDASGKWQGIVRYSSKSKACLTGTSWLGRITGLHTSVFDTECRISWNQPSFSYFVGDLIPAAPYIRFFELLGTRAGFNWRYDLRHQLYTKKSRTVSKGLVASMLERVNFDRLSEQEKAKLAKLRTLASSSLYAAEVTGMRVRPYAGYVFDLSVPGNETFWGGTTPVLLHNSDERGIDVVRERVKTFARFTDRREGIPYRLAILDECDEMTSDGQTALRRIMEENSEHTRFILICNYSSGIIEPLQSRCAIFRFQRLDEASVIEHLKSIAKKEKLKHSNDAVYGAIFEATQGDLRQAINLMQAAAASGDLTIDSVRSVSGASVKARVAEIIGAALGGDFEGARTKMVELTRVYGIPERDFLRFANEALGSMKVPDMAKAISILAEYDFRLVQGSQPELQLTAMLAQLSSLKKKAD